MDEKPAGILWLLEKNVRGAQNSEGFCGVKKHFMIKFALIEFKRTEKRITTMIECFK